MNALWYQIRIQGFSAKLINSTNDMHERNFLMSEGNVALEGLHIDGRIILNWILKKSVGRT
jgi:hypothetical protein